MSSLKLGSYAMMILACQFSLLGRPSPATATMTVTVEPLPTDVVGPPKSSEYPQPICSKCKKVAVDREVENGSSWGRLSIDYYDEVYSTFEGSIQVTVLLDDDTVHTFMIPDVELEEDDEADWTMPSQTGLSWLDVEHAWVQMVPAT